MAFENFVTTTDFRLSLIISLILLCEDILPYLLPTKILPALLYRIKLNNLRIHSSKVEARFKEEL